MIDNHAVSSTEKYEVSLYFYQRDLLLLVFCLPFESLFIWQYSDIRNLHKFLLKKKPRKEGCLEAYKLHGTCLPQNPWAVTFNTHRFLWSSMLYIFIGVAGQAFSNGQLFNSSSGLSLGCWTLKTNREIFFERLSL